MSERRSPLATIIIPYYNQPDMLVFQLKNWLEYAPHVRDRLELIVVDDGSKKAPAYTSIPLDMFEALRKTPFRLFRIDEDIPWNRGEARNIGYQEAVTRWIVQLDIDHVLPGPAAAEMIAEKWNDETWYRFKRFRVGRADHTRNKDELPRDAEFGPIKPHIDSYLCTVEHYRRAGGYNLAFSGCLGGGSPFPKEMELCNGRPELLEKAYLQVFTTDAIGDASADLDRDTMEYARRKKALGKKIAGHCEVKHRYFREL